MVSTPFFVAGNGALPDPAHFWPIQEGTGTAPSSIVGAALPFSMANTTWGVGTGRNGTNCLVFANFSRVYMADPFFYDVFSIFAWIYPTVLNAEKTVINKRNQTTGNSGTDEWEIYTTSAGLLGARKWQTSGALCLDITGATALTLNAWNHIGFTSGGNGATGKVYLGGSPDGGATQSATMVDGTSAFMLGCRVADTDATYYQGRIQEVRIYTSQLSDSHAAAVTALSTP